MGFRRSFEAKDQKSVHEAFLEDTDDPLVNHAIEIAEKNGISVSPLDVEGLAEKLGAKISYSRTLPKKIVGTIIIDPKTSNQCQIKLNQNFSPSRLRFTVAHEIGHFLKHRHWKQEEIGEDDIPAATQFNRSDRQGGEEWEANKFAAELLMPAKDVRRSIRRTSSLQKLAEEFGVSTLAMKIRLEALGLKS